MYMGGAMRFCSCNIILVSQRFPQNLYIHVRKMRNICSVSYMWDSANKFIASGRRAVNKKLCAWLMITVSVQCSRDLCGGNVYLCGERENDQFKVWFGVTYPIDLFAN